MIHEKVGNSPQMQGGNACERTGERGAEVSQSKSKWQSKEGR